jgi:Protein of unknown function (DUF3102)
MASKYGAGLVSVATDDEARKVVGAAKPDKQTPEQTQAPDPLPADHLSIPDFLRRGDEAKANIATRAAPPAVVCSQGYDYAALAADAAALAKRTADKIRQQMRRTSQEIIEIGGDLRRVKHALGHGQFGAWLRAEFDWTIRTAGRYMRAADVFSSKLDALAPAEDERPHCLNCDVRFPGQPPGAWAITPPFVSTEHAPLVVHAFCERCAERESDLMPAVRRAFSKIWPACLAAPGGHA